MSADLLQTLKILTELVVEGVGQNLSVLTVTVVLLSVQEPVGDLVLTRVLDNSNDLVDLLLSELTSAKKKRAERQHKSERNRMGSDLGGKKLFVGDRQK